MLPFYREGNQSSLHGKHFAVSRGVHAETRRSKVTRRDAVKYFSQADWCNAPLLTFTLPPIYILQFPEGVYAETRRSQVTRRRVARLHRYAIKLRASF